MSCFVINEWLWHYATGDRAQKSFALDVVDKVARSEHVTTIVVARSAFERKLFRCLKSPDVTTRTIAALYWKAIRLDSDRCRLVEPGDEALPVEYRAVRDDDWYLIRALLSDESAALVSSDAPLRQIVETAGRVALAPQAFLTRVSIEI